jgi:phospholipid/cholesterol/gamma-HCH transport system permease protein
LTPPTAARLALSFKECGRTPDKREELSEGVSTGMFRKSMVSVGDWGTSVGRAFYWLAPAGLRRRRGAVPAFAIVEQVDRFSIGVLPLLTVVLGFVGMILALQLATILELLGVVEFLPSIIGIAMVREMAPLLVGVVLSGFAGASIASEIGSMKVSDELRAYESFSIAPTRYLLAPRLVGIAIAAPIVTGLGFYLGIGGGLVIAEAILGMDSGQYITRTLAALDLQDVLLGLLKGEVFGLLVVSIAWFEGSRVTGGALGVGRATTAAVVKSVVAIIAADLLLTFLFFRIG